MHACDACDTCDACLDGWLAWPDNSLAGTEMAVRSHMLGRFDAPAEQAPPAVLLAKAGQPLLFDYRIRHRCACRHHMWNFGAYLCPSRHGQMLKNVCIP